MSTRVEQISNHFVENKNHASQCLRKKLQIRKEDKAENKTCGAGSDLELTIKLLEIKKNVYKDRVRHEYRYVSMYICVFA